jgi:hypothetical protein
VNIFWLHEDVEVSARWLVDGHVGTKMITESVQMLSWAHQHANPDILKATKKARRGIAPYISNPNRTHLNHTCTKWVRESKANYELLLSYTEAMVEEYKRRFWDTWLADTTKPASFNNQIFYLQHTPDLPDIGLTQRPKAFKKYPDLYLIPNVIDAYRQYYLVDKLQSPTAKRSRFYYRDDAPIEFMEILGLDPSQHTKAYYAAA